MKYSRLQIISVFALALVSSPPAKAEQQRVFNWLPANDESVRLDPANFHTGRTYHPDSPGQNNHVDIKAQKPVTVFMAPAGEWNAVLQHSQPVGQLQQVCVHEHITEITLVCELPVEPMTLIIQDDRPGPDPTLIARLGAVLDPNDKTERAIGAGLAVLTGQAGAAPRHFLSPNDVHIQYYRWDCAQNCVQPEIQWVSQVKEKYELSSFLKIYGGFEPDHDAEQISIKIKSPVPMLVAMLPSNVANQLHGKPEMLEPALEKNSCQQRGVQSLQFECKFDLNDGPQSLIVVPEDSAKIPKKKAEIEMWAARCVANCELLKAENK